MTPNRSSAIWRRGPWRIRRKLILLHSVFSLVLGAALLVALRPAVKRVVRASERHVLQTQDDLPGGAPVAAVDSPIARREVAKLYALVIVLLLAGYALIALALELFILPRNVWRPIARLRRADAAVKAGDHEHELIPEPEMPRDELGEIMRSRNESIRLLREHETALARALDELERVASDLKRKNHLLEAVTRNMADQERLVSLGLLSAGLAHELNTPLAVLKGGIEEIAEAPGRGIDAQRADLLRRTVARLERLSENLLDFARVRPHASTPTAIRDMVNEAWELVRADRTASTVSLDNHVAEDAVVTGDPDRLGQVFVNILRNAVDAIDGPGVIAVSARRVERRGGDWLAVEVADTGPGIDPELLPTLFEPFTTTRLDAHGTGLGLAVSEGIVREHGGVILASNGERGAVFEIVLPLGDPSSGQPPTPDEKTP